ncbi:tail assembly protein [Neisseria musculi]|uniref:Bacteriophage lambda tail assembly I family protein n=1 Tax=Neisseria musculi TaxID=1815583 RepID=A0A7H1MCA6_9NEIS|nr:tail assembly protein [Neisseria musculi]QNT59271.1 bacteriophage lambda tail assembly I family protein [Neisseria musculi]
MIRVCFYGGLRQYGRRFDLHVDSPAEALHALFSQIKGLRQYIRDGVYQVRFQGEDHTTETMQDVFRRPASGVLHIVPRVAGAGRRGGIIQTVIGVVIAVVGAYFGQAWAVQLGVGLAVGGVAQMLTKQPRLDSAKGVDAGKNTAFSNLSNTAAQGNPVPLAYGICYCGSRVVSQGIESRRVATGTGGGSRNAGNSIVRMVAAAAGINNDVQSADPLAVDLTLGMEKTFAGGVAATAPNGQKYNTDFENDSVRARNYTAAYTVT